MTSLWQEFKTFAIRGNALDLAVGVVIGAAFTAVTNSLVTDILTPPIGRLMGGVDFSALTFGLGGEAVIAYGHFIQVAVNFIITAFALFLLVKFINKFVRKAHAEATPATTPRDIELLEEIRDLLKNPTTRI
ncbi:MAG TPA: large conductance mechanosensitive channel protein MscL [Candidatus Paceibacterota bacterium]|nr:large conductance mechanosensitive channel protein MscL [Candidatus Paceibacterota bacterium]